MRRTFRLKKVVIAKRDLSRCNNPLCIIYKLLQQAKDYFAMAQLKKNTSPFIPLRRGSEKVSP